MAQQPTYKTNIQNGLPIVRFQGTTPIWLETPNAPLTTGQDFSLFIVVRNNVPAGPPTYMAPVWICGNTGVGGNGFQFYNDTTETFVYNPLGAFPVIVSGGAPTGFKMYTSTYTAGSMNVYLSGSSIYSGGAGMYSAVAASLVGVNPASTGARPTADCDYAEIILYNRVVTSGEQTTIQNYLTAKWNL